MKILRAICCAIVCYQSAYAASSSPGEQTAEWGGLRNFVESLSSREDFATAAALTIGKLEVSPDPKDVVRRYMQLLEQINQAASGYEPEKVKQLILAGSEIEAISASQQEVKQTAEKLFESSLTDDQLRDFVQAIYTKAYFECLEKEAKAVTDGHEGRLDDATFRESEDRLQGRRVELYESALESGHTFIPDSSQQAANLLERGLLHLVADLDDAQTHAALAIHRSPVVAFLQRIQVVRANKQFERDTLAKMDRILRL